MKSAKKKKNSFSLIVSAFQLHGSRAEILNFGCSLESPGSLLKQPVLKAQPRTSEVRISRDGESRYC